MRIVAFSVIVLACGLLPACHRAPSSEAAAGAGFSEIAATAAPRAGADAQGAMLAYEHDVEVRLAAQAIPARLREAQAACNQGRFGACVVLNVSEHGGDVPGASLTVRIAPDGVEPMIALAGAGAELGSRSTRAEDLAVVVRDNDLAQARLQKERERLQEFQARRDLAVADMIALSKQLAETEAALEAAEQEGAQHRRRIDTQLLTIGFQPPRGESGRGEIGQALRDFARTLAAGTAWTIRALALLLPAALVLAVLVVLVRRLRRRR